MPRQFRSQSVIERSLLLTAVLICLQSATFAQYATLAGRVLDDSTSAPLANVNIYIAGSTLGANTNENGVFEIRNIPLGNHDIVASRIGYLLSTFRTSLGEPRKREIEIRLKPTNVEMTEVVISAPDPTEWKNDLAKFSDLFLGTTRNAKGCRIMNPEVLDFKSEGNDIFEATARRSLEIENLALGYHLTFLLKSFRKEGDIMTFEGFPKFRELKPASPKGTEEWKENRMRAFRGSMRHFLMALFRRELNPTGYSIFHLDFLGVGNVSPVRKLLTENEVLYDSPSAMVKTLRFSGFLEVEYWREVESGYNLLQKAGTSGQVSWFTLNYLAVGINERGFINEEFPTKIYGYWSWRRVGDMLPLDFEPEKK
ncbi:MAG: carboxypeptidase-like regulatory domain-containing protein [Ignavibacteriales bacterium]|nr:carboxypeptidase-like regulatory domain-containing protein [Ignavibacteriales bacterium]